MGRDAARGLNVTVIGIFDNVTLAEDAKGVLLSVGVPEGRIVLNVGQDGVCVLGVHAQSSFERDRIKDLLQHNGASGVEQRSH